MIKSYWFYNLIYFRNIGLNKPILYSTKLISTGKFNGVKKIGHKKRSD
jgi:hypothetical protein